MHYCNVFNFDFLFNTRNLGNYVVLPINAKILHSLATKSRSRDAIRVKVVMSAKNSRSKTGHTATGIYRRIYQRMFSSVEVRYHAGHSEA